MRLRLLVHGLTLAPDGAPDRPPYAFAGDGIDRASELREDEAELRASFAHAKFLCITPDARVPVADRTLIATARDALGEPDDDAAFARASFLGLEGDAAWFAWPLTAGEAPATAEPAGGRPTAAPAAVRYTDLRTAAALLPEQALALSAYARSLLHWQSRKRYCGRCGAATVFDQSGHRARCSDEGCAQQYFPRTDPAIIVLVARRGRCLLGRQSSWPERRYSTLAGFVEPGETLEQAVRREVREEAGVRVGAARYLASQPWPFPAALMLGFEADALSDEIEVGAELEEARWFTAAELGDGTRSGEIKLSPKLSIAFHLIDRWYFAATGERLPPGPDWRAR